MIKIGYCKHHCEATECKTGLCNCQKCGDFIEDENYYINGYEKLKALLSESEQKHLEASMQENKALMQELAEK